MVRVEKQLTKTIRVKHPSFPGTSVYVLRTNIKFSLISFLNEAAIACNVDVKYKSAYVEKF